MKIEFLGAARTVTGSMHLIETNTKKILIDCGLFQGSKNLTEQNRNRLNFKLDEIDCVILSHAHIDHSGLIPLLCKKGYNGKIFATPVTSELCRIMLADCGKLQEEDANWERKHIGISSGAMPLYTMDDAISCMHYFEIIDYSETFEIDDVKFRFLDAGHILGSGTVEIFLENNKIVFSGDIGRAHVPILKEPVAPEDANVLIIESTYGDTIHPDIKTTERIFLDIIKRTMKNGGNLIIPAFSIGRTQHILYLLNNFIENKLLKDLEVYVDSPLAISATEIYSKYSRYFDEETQALIEKGDLPFEFHSLKFTRSVEESKEINNISRNAIIISASGMCSGGRVLHHLKHNLPRDCCTVLFVGYQAEGTLGRILLNKPKTVKIHNEIITVNANIEYMPAFSAHADQKELLSWLRCMKSKPKKIYIVHGEEKTSSVLARKINEEFGLKADIPMMNEVVSIM
ncbi:MAG: MBL fold metallo-hydrolase [Candidatus Thermoplasmatota archaeon]